MATIVDQKQQFPTGMPYDARYAAPQFTNPWGTAAPAAQNIYAQQVAGTAATPSIQQQQQQQAFSRPGSISVPYAQPTSTSNQSSFSAQGNSGDATARTYSTAPTTQQQFAAASAAAYQYPQPPAQHRYSHDYTNMHTQYAQNAQNQEAARRASYPVKPQFRSTESFHDALDASRGMLAMSQDVTPRNIYGPGARNGSIDSYGFPAAYSAHSSISSASGYPYYHSHNGSIDGSVASSSITDYSSEAENLANRTLPVPGQMMATGAFPPEPASMMNQFNSKIGNTTQKKHKCKICDKRFTRPSSLQTHMYSHTGEKPFACDFAGCGRHFSVVSNLRRHKKCHRTGNERSGSGDEE